MANAAVLFVALVSLGLPGGITLSVCLSSNTVQIHGVGQDVCGGCGAGDATSTDRAPCCGGEPGVADPEDDECMCCLELATVSKQPTRPLPDSQDNAELPRATSALDHAPDRAARHATPIRATASPPAGGSFVSPLLI